jgi:TetR/AcrR family transcriptional regulator
VSASAGDSARGRGRIRGGAPLPSGEPHDVKDPPGRKRDPVATQRRLLDAAEVEFARHGYAGARLKDIAAASGVQLTLVHHHFGDKDGLYRAVLERLISPTQALSWSLLQTQPDLETLARGFVTLLTHLYGQHRHLLAILRHEAATGSEVLTGILREQMTPVAEGAKLLLAGMQSRGEIRTDLSPTEIVALTMSMAAYPFVDGILLDTVLPGSVPSTDEDLARRCEAITTVLVRALRSQSGSGS